MATPFIPSFLWPGPCDPAARRVEIDEFIVDNAMTNLFLLALREMQDERIKKANDPSEDWFSFYDIGSIHGYPMELWRGILNKSSAKPNDGYYCTHGSTVFPLWHRCQMALFEQALYRKMEVIANKFPEERGRQNFLEALKHYRLPYWDPVMPRKQMDTSIQDEQKRVQSMFGMPEIFSREEVFVLDPGKGETSIPNPLFRFRFPSEQDYINTGRVMPNWGALKNRRMPSTGSQWTLRTPTSDGENDEQELNDDIQAQARSLSTSLWQMLNPGPQTQNRPWDTFANHFITKVPGDRWPNTVSLESWHDDIHVLVGSGDSASGHMAFIEVASFDPIFFFHHNNIERLLAIYQALYGDGQDKFVSETIVPPNRMGSKSQLYPFETKTKGTCYTSDDVRDWTLDAYAVPGVKKLDDKGKEALTKYLRDTYFWASETSRPPASLTYPRDLSTVYALKGGKFEFEPSNPVSFVALERSAVMTKAFPQDSAKPFEQAVDLSIKDETQNLHLYPPGSFVDRENGRMMTWNALTNVRKYALNGSFLVQVFIGRNMMPPDSEAPRDFLASNEVGFSAVLAAHDAIDCDNCQKNQDQIYEDIIPLTTELPKYLRANTENPDQWPPAELRVLENLEPDQVVPFLKKNLEWRVVDPAGNVKSDEEVQAAELVVAVGSRYFDFPSEGNQLGSYSEHTVYPEITSGKLGGFNG